MKNRQKTTMVASACLIVSLAASSFVLRRVDQLRPQATLDEVLFLSSPKVIKRASLGYDGLMACIYWTRAVQYFGSRHRYYAASYDLLAPLLEITTHLDPHLVVAYEFGSSFLAPKPPQGAGQPERAIELMRYGIQNNPENWRLYYDLGFVYYLELKDYKNAADTFERGSHVPNAHPFLKIFAAHMAQHAGEYETARMLWTATYQNTQDRLIKENAVGHLRVSELLAAEGLAGTPVDPDGHPYKLTPEGRVELRVPEDFPFVTRGLPPGFKPKFSGIL